MFVSLHRLNEEGHQRFETLAADPVRRLPDHNQRIADCLIIKSARGPWSAPCGLFAAEHPHGVLAMKTGHCDELIQNAAFPPTLAISVSLSYRYHQFISRRHGDPPHPRLHSRISVGSKLDEATAQYPGAFLAGGVAGLVGIESGVVSGLLNPNDSALEAPMETTPWKGLSRSLLSCMQKAAQVPSFLRTGSIRSNQRSVRRSGISLKA